MNVGICALINGHEHYNIVASSLNGEDLINTVKTLRIQILIIELGYPNKCNLNYISKIISIFPDIKLLLITSLFKQGIINQFIDLGVNAYISTKSTDKDLFNALEKLENNESYFCSAVTQLLLRELHDVHDLKNKILTTREIEIMNFLINGMSNEVISKKLNISLHTVKTHRKNMMDKFGVKSLLSLVRYACRANLIDEENDFFCISCPYKLATE
jgi:DNA-binding NarL/FixJ family response regulator